MHLVPTSCPDCGKRSAGLRRCQACRDAHGTVTALLRGLGVLGDKHIPKSYLRASEAQRRDLLAGLLDTDGTVTNAGCVQFTVTSRVLAEGVRELVVSLGYRCTIATRAVNGRSPESSTAYHVNFTCDDDVFWLPRKALLHKQLRRKTVTRRSSRFITDVRRIASLPVRCIEVAADDHLYLAGQSMIPTHNSTIGLDIVRSAAIKHKMAAVVFSLEMSRTEITMRLLSAEAGIQLQHMRKGTMREEDWTRLASTMGRVSEAPLFIDDSPNMSLMEIRAKCRRLKQRENLKLVVIDYLQLMSSGKRVESRQQEVSEFSRALKLLAKELEVPVIAISQLNRGAEQRTDKKPAMSDLRESGCLTADTMVTRADTGAQMSIAELVDEYSRNPGSEVPVWSLDESLRYVRATHDRGLLDRRAPGLPPHSRLGQDGPGNREPPLPDHVRAGPSSATCAPAPASRCRGTCRRRSRSPRTSTTPMSASARSSSPRALRTCRPADSRRGGARSASTWSR